MWRVGGICSCSYVCVWWIKLSLLLNDVFSLTRPEDVQVASGRLCDEIGCARDKGCNPPTTYIAGAEIFG